MFIFNAVVYYIRINRTNNIGVIENLNTFIVITYIDYVYFKYIYVYIIVIRNNVKCKIYIYCILSRNRTANEKLTFERSTTTTAHKLYGGFFFIKSL